MIITEEMRKEMAKAREDLRCPEFRAASEARCRELQEQFRRESRLTKPSEALLKSRMTL
ncbi:hypothetical protein [Neptuniibacter sp. QD37_11]|uniref:hypothetical protein n=1 Tax=Neptuniibacter sp. QD37_11 TaxID=3398209 RepID=UPI0039F49238